MHLADEVPLDFHDKKHVKPDNKYGAPPVINSSPNSNNNPPSPTYGVPGLDPGSPSTRIGNSFPNEYEQPPVLVSKPAPTYGPPAPTYGPPLTSPKNAYIPPINKFQVNPSIQSPNYYSSKGADSSSSGDGAGYVYNKPNANLKSSPQQSAKLQAKQASVGEDDSKSDEDKDEGSIRGIQFTTETPRAAPDFFFSEQFEQRPPVVTSSLPIPQQQQHAFHPQEQPFLPNSPPAPFSTAVYQEQQRSQRLQQEQQLEPLPTLALDTEPPSPQAKNYFDSQPAQSSSNYNQADWFRRISRSLGNESAVVEVIRIPERNETFLSEMRSKMEMLRSLYSGEEEAEEDLVINFEAAHGGNRTNRRTKRQSIEGNRLCEVTTRFIEPQAGLTRDGEY